MAEQTAPALGVAFSIQNDGQFIGIHFDTPLSSYVVAFPIESARELAKQFGIQLEETLRQRDEQYPNKKNPLIVANAGTMDMLKKGHR